MWWEYVIIGAAVLGAVLWLIRRFTTATGEAGCACGPKRCGNSRDAHRIQTDIPDFRTR